MHTGGLSIDDQAALTYYRGCRILYRSGQCSTQGWAVLRPVLDEALERHACVPYPSKHLHCHWCHQRPCTGHWPDRSSEGNAVVLAIATLLASVCCVSSVKVLSGSQQQAVEQLEAVQSRQTVSAKLLCSMDDLLRRTAVCKRLQVPALLDQIVLGSNRPLGHIDESCQRSRTRRHDCRGRQQGSLRCVMCAPPLLQHTAAHLHRLCPANDKRPEDVLRVQRCCRVTCRRHVQPLHHCLRTCHCSYANVLHIASSAPLRPHELLSCVLSCSQQAGTLNACDVVSTSRSAPEHSHTCRLLSA